jgi:predicted DNA-binding WGR domain protein
MRTFTLGSGTDRKVVTVEVRGNVLRVTQAKAEGVGKRNEKGFAGEAEASSAAERTVRELLARGYAERTASPKSRQAVPAARKGESDGLDLGALADAGEGVAAAEAVLPRMAAPVAAAAEAAPKKKKKKSGKKKKAAGGDDGLDQRVLAAVGFVGVALVAVVGFLVYEAVLKPASIVGHWEGSRLDFEIGRPMVHTQYRLILDDQRRAAMTLQEKFTSKGTYSLQGDRLKLALKDEDGDASEVQYKVSLGGATLDLFDPESGKKMVQLVRFRQAPSVGGGAPAPSAPKDAAGGAVDKADDERLASVQFSPKDGAFKLRHPAGWTPETGSRPDNTYSWGRFTKDSAKIQVYADVAGSLMAGTNNSPQEEGSVLAPVHGAHVNYQKTISKEYSDFKESEPAPFKGAALGEGRIATFTASAGGLFGGKIRGYRVTLLTNDRRVSLLCECPEGEFEKYKPTFLAVCRSVSR